MIRPNDLEFLMAGVKGSQWKREHGSDIWLRCIKYIVFIIGKFIIISL